MNPIVIFYQTNRLQCCEKQSYFADAKKDCPIAFSLLENGNNINLQCSIRSLLEFCHSRYTWVRAAGGVVVSNHGTRLLIRREGKWDLPKGMVEQGETLTNAALREVHEETGVTAHVICNQPITKTYHIYNKYGGWHLKQTSWFLMTANEITTLSPQYEEGIEVVEWMDKATWESYLQNSFASLQQVVQNMNKSI